MKTRMSHISKNTGEVTQSAKWKFQGTVIILVLILASFSTVTVAQKFELNVNLQLPSWAPYYERTDRVNYYYFPDIECYYDVRNREFIYLEDGEWLFGRSLPRAYSWYDLNDCFIVALDARVYEPWRHSNYYVSHYPRYYYRTVYRDRYNDRERRLRGFNENQRSMVYNKRYDNDREHNSRMRRNESERKENNRFENRNENRNENKEINREDNKIRREFPDRRVVSTHPAEPVKYNGKDVGRPVRVQKNMRKTEEIKVRENKTYRQR